MDLEKITLFGLENGITGRHKFPNGDTADYREGVLDGAVQTKEGRMTFRDGLLVEARPKDWTQEPASVSGYATAAAALTQPAPQPSLTLPACSSVTQGGPDDAAEPNWPTARTGKRVNSGAEVAMVRRLPRYGGLPKGETSIVGVKINGQMSGVSNPKDLKIKLAPKHPADPATRNRAATRRLVRALKRQPG